MAGKDDKKGAGRSMVKPVKRKDGVGRDADLHAKNRRLGEVSVSPASAQENPLVI
jgi:hypothetical protein